MRCFEEAALYLKKLKFRKALFGVDERDVWKKIRALDEIYRQALEAQKMRDAALIAEREQWLSELGHPVPSRGDEK